MMDPPRKMTSACSEVLSVRRVQPARNAVLQAATDADVPCFRKSRREYMTDSFSAFLAVAAREPTQSRATRRCEFSRLSPTRLNEYARSRVVDQPLSDQG